MSAAGAGEVSPAVDNTLFSGGAKNLQDWSNLIDSMFGKSQTVDKNEQVLTQLSSQADNPLMLMIMQLMGQAKEGVNSQQIQALLGPIFQQLQTATIPGIQNAANAGGGVYNSTTQQLLKNDALARATAQGGNLVVTQQNNLQQQLAALMAILAKSTQTTAQNTGSSTKTSNSGSVSGGGLGKALGMGAGAAAAAKAIKNLTTSQPYKGGQGRSDEQDDTSGMPAWKDPNSGSDNIKPSSPPGEAPDATNYTPEPFAEGAGSLNAGGTEGNVGAELGTDFLDGIFGGNEGSFENSGGFGAGEYDSGGGGESFFDFGGDTGLIFGGEED